MTAPDVLEAAVKIIDEEYRRTLRTNVGPYDQDAAPHVPRPQPRPCARCDHAVALHVHQRGHPTTHCASCGRAACWAYQPRGIIAAAIRALRRFGAWWKRVTQ